MKPTIETTIELIKLLHDGQFDWSGKPYWEHPVAVMNGLPEGSSENRKMLALLHDTVEDCKDKIASLLGIDVSAVTTDVGIDFFRSRGYDEHVLTGLRLLTRDGTHTYLNGIKNIVASGHIDAMEVKLSDNDQNTNATRFDALSEDDKVKAISMARRYEKSKAILREGLGR